MQTLAKIPTSITVGDSVAWRVGLNEYPASAGWEISYILLNKDGKITISASADGDGHFVSLRSSETRGYAPGHYRYTVLATLDGDRVTIGSGSIGILPDPLALESYDGRSYAEKTLEAIEAVIANKATNDQLQYSVGGMSLARYTWDDLMKMRNSFRSEVANEQSALTGRNGNKILVRFV